MNQARLLRSLCLSCPALLIALAVAVSCSNQNDSEPFVPSQRGAVQPDAGGPLLIESEACLRLKGAEISARAALSCPTQSRVCPGYIRPAGGNECFQYSEASINACATLYDTFTTCEEFTLHPCLVSAVPMCDTPVGGEGGAGGAPSALGGAGGSPGAGGEAATEPGSGAGGV